MKCKVSFLRICIIGTGYVGLCTGVGFASKKDGNTPKVICVDIDQNKVDRINRGEAPIYEPGLTEKLSSALAEGSIRATSDLKEALNETDVCFISVPTPSREDGSIELDYIKKVAESVGSVLKDMNRYYVVTVKSTVVPETTENDVVPIIEKSSGKSAGKDFGVCMNPEFLREGCALEDFMNPDRIVIGEMDSRAGDVVNRAYTGFDAPIMRTNIKTAEMIKYTANSLLATKISFSNEIGNICKSLGIDVYGVMKGVGMDNRISEKFLNAGCGFGGSCFPKDVAALVAKAKQSGVEPRLIEQVLESNRRQRGLMAEQVRERLGNLKDKRIAVLGLAFNPNTDDVRESPAIDTIRKLIESGAEVSAYDPRAMDNMKKVFPDITYAKNAGEALEGADACIIATDWDEFKGLIDEDFTRMKGDVIIEGRKVLKSENVKCFEGVCW
jgi:UDPglucose 6-dehydrogenase